MGIVIWFIGAFITVCSLFKAGKKSFIIIWSIGMIIMIIGGITYYVTV